YGLPLLELLLDLLVISNKVECRIKQPAPQQLQKPRKSSLSNDRHGGIMKRRKRS
ncbi:hypothetical protein Gotur_014310, partial [Gossypium turneri]